MPVPNGGDTPQTPCMAKLKGRALKPGKQIAHEMLPGPHARSTITAGDAVQRGLGNYAKMTPADASGKGQIGFNIFSMGRGQK